MALAPVGTQFHGMWDDYTDHTRVAVLDALRAAGVTSVRLDLAWSMLQPRDPHRPPNGATGARWADLRGVQLADRVIDMCVSRDIRPLVTLWLTPKWASGRYDQHVLPADPASYARVAEWVARRWRGKVLGWEVWNEPNSPDFLIGADPAAYTALLKAAYPRFHDGDPDTTVVFGGLQHCDDDWLDACYAAGARGSFDALGVHPYPGRADQSPEEPDDGTVWTTQHLAAVRQVMTYHQDRSPVWLTEIGWSTHPNYYGTQTWERGVTEATQAAYLAAAAKVAAAMPYVERVYWYDERDDDVAELHRQHFGLMRRDLKPKPALAALAEVNANLVGKVVG